MTFIYIYIYIYIDLLENHSENSIIFYFIILKNYFINYIIPFQNTYSSGAKNDFLVTNLKIGTTAVHI